MIESQFAWMNGKIIPFAQATTHISAFTLHYGVAAFEGIRCYKRDDGRSAVFRLHEHIERLFGSMKVCGNQVPYSLAEVENACLEVLRQNKLAEAYLRPLVYAGPGSLGLGAKLTTRMTSFSTTIFAPWMRASHRRILPYFMGKR